LIVLVSHSHHLWFSVLEFVGKFQSSIWRTGKNRACSSWPIPSTWPLWCTPQGSQVVRSPRPTTRCLRNQFIFNQLPRCKIANSFYRGLHILLPFELTVDPRCLPVKKIDFLIIEYFKQMCVCSLMHNTEYTWLIWTSFFLSLITFLLTRRDWI